jgi:hypothetical protein
MRTSNYVLSIVCLSAACAQASIEMDGFVLERNRTEELLGKLRRRASFDLGCPPQELSFTMLAVHDDAGPDMPKQVGVIGCKKRATYTMEYLISGGVSMGVGYTYVNETGWQLDAAGIHDLE